MYEISRKRWGGVFTVIKKVEQLDEQEKIWTRLAWDCRRVNLKFKRAPWVPLGSPAGLGLLELAPSMLQGRTIGTYQGDVPDMFYRVGFPRSSPLGLSCRRWTPLS